jgi:dTDP-6-deoxy-L-talose 4-dehydrogenase (NAD+)
VRVLVTGASGFVGNHVVRELLTCRHDVVATCNNPEKAQTYNWFDKVTYIHQDLKAEVDDYFAFFEQPDRLIHLAWEGLPDYKSFIHLESNLLWNWLFIRNMVEHGLRDVTAIGTCLEYGLQDGKLAEDIEPRPTTAYGLAKDCLRRFIEQLAATIDFTFKWVRLFYLYGEGQNPKAILPQLDQALISGQEQFNMSKGDQVRDYLPVENVARNIVKIALQDKVTGIINCCSGLPITIKQLVENHLNRQGKSIKLNTGYYSCLDYEPESFWGDTKKLNIILGGNSQQQVGA